MKLDFSGKTIVLTGASGGICSNAAQQFLDMRAKVVCLDLRYTDNAATVEWAQNPVKIKLDVTSRADVFATVDAIQKNLKRIDVLINGAGILRAKPFLQITEGEWHEMMDINATGTFFMMQAALPYMMEHKAGSIVNMSSISGQIGGIMAGADYCAAKAAILGLTKAVAKFAAPARVRINAIAPGGINTPMINVYREAMGEKRVDEVSAGTPLGRFGEAEEVANVIVFLAAEASSHMTGATVEVNGGTLMH